MGHLPLSDTLALLRNALKDRYAVDRLLGEGGMAFVYRAEDLKHHRPVAIKVLKPELSANIGAERFLRVSSSPPSCSIRTWCRYTTRVPWGRRCTT